MRNLLLRSSVVGVSFLLGTTLLSSNFSADPAGAAQSSAVVEGRYSKPVRPAKKATTRQYRYRGRVSRSRVRPAPRPRVRPAPRPKVARTVRPQAVPTGDVWARLRQCESGGNYRANTGNGFYGAYQFVPSTWRGLGFPGMPHQAPPEMQDAAAQKLQARSGWGQWPACTRRLGLR